MRATLNGIRAELVSNGMIAMIHYEILGVDAESEPMSHFDEHFVDDMSGQTLRTDLVL